MDLNRRRFVLGTGAAFGAALGGSALMLSGSGAAVAQVAAAEPPLREILSDADAPAMGNLRGDMTIVEYYDYQCPFCRENHAMLLEVLDADRGLRLVMKDWPVFGPVSGRAARLALGAHGLGKYPSANTALMSTRGKLTDQSVDQALRRAGVDPAAAWTSYEADAAKWDGLIARNHAQAAALGFFGTPSYVIGAVIIPGVINKTTMLDVISEARRVGIPA